MQTVSGRTTQNVLIDYPLASVGDRILAYLIDRVILILYTIGLVSLFNQFNIDTLWVWMIFGGIPWLFYSLAFEILMNGQTPGKRVLKIQVVRLDGTTPTIGNYLFRWIFSFVDFYFMSGIVAVLCITMGGKGQRVGDMVAGTTVVKAVAQEEITSETIFAGTRQTQKPTFTQVSELSDRDVELIHRALDAWRRYDNYTPVEALADKLKARLGIRSDLSPVDFLNTVVHDHSLLVSGHV